MPQHGVMRLGYVHARVTDLAAAKSHYGSTMGLYATHEADGTVFYKGWDEWDHHSLVLTEGGVGVAKLGFKVTDAGEIATSSTVQARVVVAGSKSGSHPKSGLTMAPRKSFHDMAFGARKHAAAQNHRLPFHHTWTSWSSP